MFPYVFLIFLIVCGAVVPSRIQKKYTLFVFLFLLLLVGLRHYSLGCYDTELMYVPKFEVYKNLSYAEVYNRQKSKDLVFYLFVKLLSGLFEDTHIIIFLLSIPFLAAVYWLVTRYSTMPWMSMILFLGLGYYGMGFYLIRQVLAMTFIIFSYKPLNERKLVPFLILIAIASLFHQTALVFLITYPLINRDFSVKYFILIAAGILLTGLSQVTIISSLFNLMSLFISDTQRYESYLTRESNLNIVGFLIQICVLLCIIILLMIQNKLNYKTPGHLLKPHKDPNPALSVQNVNAQLNLYCISIFFMAFSSVLGEFWRISSFFGIFVIALLPNCIFSLKNSRNKKLMVAIVTGIFIFYFICFRLENARMIPYRFFWQS